MAAVYGHVGPFDVNIEKFADYVGRYEAFVTANAIEEEKQVHVFLAMVGPQTYHLLKNLCDPDNLNTKSYAALKGILQAHYEPAPIVIVERCPSGFGPPWIWTPRSKSAKFWTASQGEDESVADFVARLKKLASTCSFGVFLTEAVRDRLVSGLHSKMSRTQRHLLSVRDLTYTTAHDQCIADELASKANKEHMGESVSDEANKLQEFNPSKGRKSSSGSFIGPRYGPGAEQCKACGSKPHSADVCKFKNATCHHCQRKGHICPVCKARLPESSFQRSSSSARKANMNNCELDSQHESKDQGDDAEGFGLYRTRTDTVTVKP